MPITVQYQPSAATYGGVAQQVGANQFATEKGIRQEGYSQQANMETMRYGQQRQSAADQFSREQDLTKMRADLESQRMDKAAALQAAQEERNLSNQLDHSAKLMNLEEKNREREIAKKKAEFDAMGLGQDVGQNEYDFTPQEERTYQNIKSQQNKLKEAVFTGRVSQQEASYMEETLAGQEKSLTSQAKKKISWAEQLKRKTGFLEGVGMVSETPMNVLAQDTTKKDEVDRQKEKEKQRNNILEEVIKADTQTYAKDMASWDNDRKNLAIAIENAISPESKTQLEAQLATVVANRPERGDMNKIINNYNAMWKAVDDANNITKASASAQKDLSQGIIPIGEDDDVYSTGKIPPVKVYQMSEKMKQDGYESKTIKLVLYKRGLIDRPTGIEIPPQYEPGYHLPAEQVRAMNRRKNISKEENLAMNRKKNNLPNWNISAPY